MEHALTDERTALTYAPEEPALLMNVAYLHCDAASTNNRWTIWSARGALRRKTPTWLSWRAGRTTA